ncbi:MAG: hypothetical protein PHC49_10540 [Desulfuromonadaceae bacterium]|nr:hypothetical protein [Desulfuromonadaceae bacterium]
MTITIPIWLLYILGLIVLLVIGVVVRAVRAINKAWGNGKISW